MKTEMKIPVRCYPVKIKDNRTGETTEDTIVLGKLRLKGAAAAGFGYDTVIYQAYNLQGYRVCEIGKPVAAEITVDPKGAYDAALAALEGKEAAENEA